MAKKLYTVTLTLPNGKRKYFRGATKKEAEAKRDEAVKQLDAGIDVGNDMTVKELCELWLKDYKKGNVRDVTYRGYNTRVYAWIIPALGALRVIDVRPVHIRHMLSGYNKLAKGTCKGLIQTTRAIFDVAVEELDMIPKNPCLKNIKATGEEPEKVSALTKAQTEELLAAAKDTQLYLFVLLALKAGLRRGELLGLMWSDIDFDTGMLTVQRSVSYTAENPQGELVHTVKTEAGYRDIPLPQSTLAELKEYKGRSQSLYVIHGRDGSYMPCSALSYNWTKLASRLSFPCHPHQLRHTCITNWFADAGLDIKEVQYCAGHSCPNMTLERYTHYLKQDRMEQTKKKIQAV